MNKRAVSAARIGFDPATQPVLHEAFEETWSLLQPRFAASAELAKDASDTLVYLLASLSRRGTRNSLDLTRLSYTLMDTLYPEDDR